MARKTRLAFKPNPAIEAAKTLRVAPVLDRVIYLHANGETWERVPFQVFGGEHGVVHVRVGQNVYALSAVKWAEAGGRTRIGGMVEDWQPDPGPGNAKYSRGALFRARFSGGDEGKPLLPRSDYRSAAERAEWQADERRRKAERRAYSVRLRRRKAWKPSPAEAP